MITLLLLCYCCCCVVLVFAWCLQATVATAC